jgi:hypothetical protein
VSAGDFLESSGRILFHFGRSPAMKRHRVNVSSRVLPCRWPMLAALDGRSVVATTWTRASTSSSRRGAGQPTASVKSSPRAKYRAGEPSRRPEDIAFWRISRDRQRSYPYTTGWGTGAPCTILLQTADGYVVLGPPMASGDCCGTGCSRPTRDARDEGMLDGSGSRPGLSSHAPCRYTMHCTLLSGAQR